MLVLQSSDPGALVKEEGPPEDLNASLLNLYKSVFENSTGECLANKNHSNLAQKVNTAIRCACTFIIHPLTLGLLCAFNSWVMLADSVKKKKE